MYITILSVLVSLLTGIGLITIIDWIMPIINRPKCGIFCYCIIPLKDNPSDLEQILRWGYTSIIWDRWLKGSRMILLDVGLDEQGQKICETFCSSRDDIWLLTSEQFFKILSE